jgi:tetratricopeptide (TPR) repeat protein
MSERANVTGLAAAERYIEIGRPRQALEALAGLDAETASSPRARTLRAFALYGEEDFARAADAARDGLAEDPDSVQLLYVLSLSLEQVGDLGGAESAVLAALRLLPEDVELLCQYAAILMRAGQLDKATRLVDVASGIDPESPDVFEARLTLAYLRADDREVKRLTEALLAMDPESARGHRMLGVLAFNQGRAVEAAERFAHTVRADPTDERFAADAREARALRSPLWWPNRFIQRYGVAQTWIAYIVIAFGLRAAGLVSVAAIIGGVWLLFCIYTWVAPPILRRVQGLGP